MKQGRERSIVSGLLVICVAAAFACFAFILLPDQLKKAGAFPLDRSATNKPINLSSIISLKESHRPTATQLPGGTIAKFTPEGAPSDPYAVAGEKRTPYIGGAPDDEAVAGGAGVAIDSASSESRLAMDAAAGKQTPSGQQAAPAANGSEADLAPGDPYGDPPTSQEGASLQQVDGANGRLMELKESSFAKHERPSTDTEKGKREKPWLSAPQGLEADVAFWRDIYAKYDRNKVVLHHPRHLEIVYEVVDLSDIEQDPRLVDVERSHQRESRVDERKKAITDILKKLAMNPTSSSLTDEEWRIKKLFADVREEDAFRRAAEEDGVRAQLGQRDKFIIGLTYSGRYLGEIESIFDSYGLPRELTRIIFVESMFNPNAMSSVGASGIWQFMRGTGKLYLRINDLIDERNDPIISTHAAARLLRHNYESLGSWPLAINAYNAGRGRLEQAVAQMGTTDIGLIIKSFSHPSYGFASRNFFLEFLAAYDVAEHAEKYFGPIQYNKPLKYEVVHSDYHISLPDVARLAQIPMEEIDDLNPAFSPSVISGAKLLPAGIDIKVPQHKGQFFLAAAARAPRSRSGPMNHVVKDGETLPSIAEMYGVTPAAILKSNQHVGRSLTPGQKIVIPQGRSM